MTFFDSSVEILESRIAPATFTVNTLNDVNDAPGSATVSLRDAINMANSHPGADTIVFKTGLTGALSMSLGEFLITDTLSIKGPGANKIIINANQGSRIFDCNNGNTAVDSPVSISGLALVNGKVSGTTGITGDGGAIFSYESLTLIADVITGNSAHGSSASHGFGGGGVCVVAEPTGVNAGSVTIKNCVISGNTSATGEGGGIYARAKEGITVTNTTISGNIAGNEGGGGLLYGGSAGTAIHISGVTAVGNSTPDSGGGLNIVNDGVPTTVINSQFIANAATGGQGGGLSVIGFTDVISGCAFRGNTALGKGGGMFLVKAKSLEITATKVTGNKSSDVGGGVVLYGYDTTAADSILKISKSQVSNNSSGSEGGGLYGFDGFTLTMSSTSVDGNHAAIFGGGMATAGGPGNTENVKITGGDFSGNGTPEATGSNGGGLGLESAGNVTISGTAIRNNECGVQGGGIYIDVSGAVVLTELNVTGNYAEDGGGILLDSSGGAPTFQIKGVTMTGNTALYYGGGLEIEGAAIGSIASHITGNFANISGGGIYNTDGNATLSPGTTVTGNAAPANPNTFGI